MGSAGAGRRTGDGGLVPLPTGMAIDALMAVAPAGLAIIDRDLCFVRVNARLAAMNGLPAEDHAGRPVAAVIPDLAGQVEAAMRRILAGEDPAETVFTGETPARPGEQHSWRTSWRPLRGADGEVLGAVVAVEEITAEKVALRRHDYLLRLEERLRGARGADAALDAACAMLGEELGATFVGLSRVEEDGIHGVVENEWRAGDTPSLLRRRRPHAELDGALADGLAGNVAPGSITFDLARSHVEGIVLVEEPEIGWWHELDAGFAGRRPL